MNKDYRRAKRKQATEQIDVHDAIIERVVGQIGNISETGMMLLANHAMEDDALFQLSFTLGDASDARRTVSVGAHQLWSEPANVPHQYWTGFRFIDISADDLAVLRVWINLPGSHYV